MSNSIYIIISIIFWSPFLFLVDFFGKTLEKIVIFIPIGALVLVFCPFALAYIISYFNKNNNTSLFPGWN